MLNLGTLLNLILMKEMNKKVFVRHNLRLKEEVFLKVEKLAEIENRTINNMVETLLIRGTDHVGKQ
jgi:hypothetical protein